MKSRILGVVFLVVAHGWSVASTTTTAFADRGKASGKNAFPTKPIKIVVYMKPGGLIDATARKFVAVAAKHTDATFVVENKHGAGGIVAMQKVQRQKADGYTILACTKSNISKTVSCDVEQYLSDFHWLAFLMADPECVITRRDSGVTSWTELVEDATARPGGQLWLGPENGGLDHVTALKIWDAAGISAKWIPCSSGSEARGKLLGRQGVAYVGNPRETLANEELVIAAVCSDKRLPQFPDAPTFRELGLEGLGNESMWRGFAIKKGSPPETIEWYEDLFRKVTADPDWRTYWENGGIDVRFESHGQFSKIVEQDRQDFRRYLTKIGLIREETGTQRWILSPFLAVAITSIIVGAIVILRRRVSVGTAVVVGIVFGVAVTMLCHTFAFPPSTSVGPAIIPRLYMVAIGLITILLLVGGLTPSCKEANSATNRPPSSPVIEFIFFMVAYWVVAAVGGYVLATALFLGTVLFRLGIHRPLTVGTVTVCWIGLSYVVFAKALYVPLPRGILWESF